MCAQRAEAVTIVLGAVGLADIYAQVLAGLGHTVVYAPLGAAMPGLLPRVPDVVASRLSPPLRAALAEAMVPLGTLHDVVAGHPYWDATVRYADTAGYTLPLRPSRALPQRDTAPKWQPFCATRAWPLPLDGAVSHRTPVQLQRDLVRRWGRWYWQVARDPEALRHRVRRVVALLGTPVQPADVPVIHPFQQSLPGFAWSAHEADGWSGGYVAAPQAGGARCYSAVSDRGDSLALLAEWPVQIWEQKAVLARGSAWWYDACGPLRV